MKRDPNMPRIHKSDDTIEVKKVTLRGVVIAEKELFFMCYAIRDRTIPLQLFPLYIFSAFETNVFHLSLKENWNDEDLEVFKQYAYVSMPAEKVPMKQHDVEEYYIKIRRVIGKSQFIHTFS